MFFLIVFVYFLVPVLMKYDTNQLWASLTAFVKLLAGFTGAFCSRSFGWQCMRVIHLWEKTASQTNWPQCQSLFMNAMPSTNINICNRRVVDTSWYPWYQQIWCLSCDVHCSVQCGHVLGQFSHLRIMNLFSFSQLRREQSSHNVLKQNCGVVLPVFQVLRRENKGFELCIWVGRYHAKQWGWFQRRR